jgi:hypothetical protein
MSEEKKKRFFDCGPGRPDSRDGGEKSRPSAQNDGVHTVGPVDGGEKNRPSASFATHPKVAPNP